MRMVPPGSEDLTMHLILFIPLFIGTIWAIGELCDLTRR